MGHGRKFPNRLRRHRKIAGYSQCEAAQLLGLRSANRLSRWEQGQSLPSLRNIFKLCALYKTLAEELYSDVLNEARQELNNIKSKH